MPGKDITLLVLAGGLSSRYGSSKQEEAVGPAGELLLEYNLFDALQAGIRRVIIVVRDQVPVLLTERLSFFKNKMEILYVSQSACYPSDRNRPWGTGHAVLSAAALVSGSFLVVNADDLYGADMYGKAVQHANQVTNEQGFLLAYRLRDTLSENGEVSRGLCTVDEEGNLLKIAEYKGIARKNGQIMSGTRILNGSALVSMNAWLLPASVLTGFDVSFQTFSKQHGADPDVEFFLPDAVSVEMNKGLFVQVRKCDGPWCGLTHPADLMQVRETILQAVLNGKYPTKWM